MAAMQADPAEHTFLQYSLPWGAPTHIGHPGYFQVHEVWDFPVVKMDETALIQMNERAGNSSYSPAGSGDEPVTKSECNCLCPVRSTELGEDMTDM
jgi:hypothetical protein